MAMTAATSVTFMQGFGPLSLAPTFPYLMEAFDADIAAVVRFTGIAILVLGFSNFIWYVLFPLGCFQVTNKVVQGPSEHLVRSSWRLHRLPTGLLRFIHLACQGNNLQ